MFQRRVLVKRMLRIVSTSCLLLSIAPLAMAQDLPAFKEIETFEVSVGYTFVRPESGQANLNGAYFGFAKPVNNWFTIAAEISSVVGSQTLSVGDSGGPVTVDTRVDFISAGVGPRLTYSGEQISPFAHALFGLARANCEVLPKIRTGH